VQDPDRWPKAIRAGEPQALYALGKLLADMSDARFSTLSFRETEILQAIADTGNMRLAAERLYVTRETIKFTAGRIRLKLEARNTTHAVAIGIREGLIG
jgi:DNA-binding NarL/FixJ family response regulator